MEWQPCQSYAETLFSPKLQQHSPPTSIVDHCALKILHIQLTVPPHPNLAHGHYIYLDNRKSQSHFNSVFELVGELVDVYAMVGITPRFMNWSGIQYWLGKVYSEKSRSEKSRSEKTRGAMKSKKMQVRRIRGGAFSVRHIF